MNRIAGRQRENRKKVVAERRGMATANKQLTELVRLETADAGTVLPTVPDVPRFILKRNKVYSFTRTLANGVIAATGTDFTLGYQFSLSQLPDYVDFTDLFDQYRIIQIEMEFLPTSTSAGGGPLLTAIDYDDASNPTASGINEYTTLQKTAPGHACIRRWTPHVALGSYSAGFYNQPMSIASPWLSNVANTTVHYALKVLIPAVAGNTAAWFVTSKLTVQCRNPV